MARRILCIDGGGIKGAMPAAFLACIEEATKKRVVDHFDLSQPTIPHHLKVLREAGLLRAGRRGIWSFYEVDRKGIELLADATGLCAPPPARA